MSSEDPTLDFVEEKKTRKGGVCKVLLRFLGSNVGLFLALRKFPVKFFSLVSDYKMFGFSLSVTENVDCSLYIVGGAYVFIYLESDLEELERMVTRDVRRGED